LDEVFERLACGPVQFALGSVDEIIEAGDRYRNPAADIAERHQHGVGWPRRAVSRDAGRSGGEQQQLLGVAEIAVSCVSTRRANAYIANRARCLKAGSGLIAE
jgi:hypothetical protein